MSVPVHVEINEQEKLLIPDRDIETTINCFLISIFCKQHSSEELVRSEKMLLFLLLKEIPIQCIVIETEQLDAFKDAIKMHDVGYHASPHISNPDYQVLFYREIDSITVNEVIRNKQIEVIADLGSLKTEDPDLEQHTNSATQFVNDDELLDFYKLFMNYMQDGGTVDEYETYMKSMAAGPLFETLIQTGQIKGIKISELKIAADDPDLRVFDPDSELKGGHGTTNYFERAKQIKMQAKQTQR